jgi:hypothetical protein
MKKAIKKPRVESIDWSRRIEVIMTNFDFQKVHRAMVALNWTWYHPGGFAIPDIDTLRKSARELLEGVEKHSQKWKAGSESIGGFTSEWNVSGGELNLLFAIDECHANDLIE